MYDSAKRSLVFTVATGGLLLTGSAFSPAMAATGLGMTQGPAHTHEAGGAISAAQALRAATASGSGEAAENSAPHGGAAQPPDLLFPQSATGAAGSAAGSHTVDPGAGDPLRLPVDLGRQLCDSARDEFSPGAAADGGCRTDAGLGAGLGGTAQTPAHRAEPGCADTMAAYGRRSDERRPTCAAAEGSAPTLPEESAADYDGASATAPSRGFAHMPIGIPVSMPMMRSSMSRVCAADAVRGDTGERAQAGEVCAPPEDRSDYPADSSTCTPPPPTCPPTTPPATTPPTTTPPTTTPPSHVVYSFPPTPPHVGHLPQTGADVDVALGAAGAALVAGLGLRGASRRRRSH